jgi:hypothetical protein
VGAALAKDVGNSYTPIRLHRHDIWKIIVRLRNSTHAGY